MAKKCPECGERVVQGPPVRTLFIGESARLRWHHKDGEPLCPVMTKTGYQPAFPVED